MTAPRPILVTAFGPFGGRSVNASSLALDRLRRADGSLRSRTLPVDRVEAPRRLRDAFRRLSPGAVLMLGEAGEARRIRLETRAWNELDFTIPDLAGRQPRGLPIDPGGPAHLATGIDCGALLRDLRRDGHDAELSGDPGRYLCNLLYHTALRRAAVPALFVHLPLESRLAPATAAAALRVILARISTTPRNQGDQAREEADQDGWDG